MVTREYFGSDFSHNPVTLYRIINTDGSSVGVIDYGATIQSVCVPDRQGHMRDVVLGYENAGQYITEGGFLGATPGRVANRIGGASFELNGKKYELAKNDGPNTLHGGIKGFDKQMWNAETGDDWVELSRLSPDGEENFPGNLNVSVRFTFTPDHVLQIRYQAATDSDTLVNLTNHSYFNLDGMPAGDMRGQMLMINADKITEGDGNTLPTGKFIDVEGTPFDFRKPKAIGADINSDSQQLKFAGGYDHNFCLNGEGFRHAASAYSDVSGIKMECWTDQPGMQFFSSNNVYGSAVGKRGMIHRFRTGFCLETQHYPNANQCSHFPSIVLKAGDKYDTVTEYRFM